MLCIWRLYVFGVELGGRMTKTLTEQWREGKLPENTYYVQFICGRYGVYEFEQFKGFGFDNDLAYIKEVIAPVPSYEEWKELKEQRDWYETRNYERAALINKLREQLNEANKLIKECKNKIEWNKVILTSYPPKEGISDYLYSKVNDYLEKWGVK